MVHALRASMFCLLVSVFSLFSFLFFSWSLFAATPTSSTAAATAAAAKAQRWNALEQILQNLKDDPEAEDDQYLLDGSTRSLLRENLEKCSYDTDEMAAIDQLIEIFWDKEKGTTRPYGQIAKGLDEMRDLSFTERVQLKTGALADASFTLGALKTHSCKAFLQWQIELGATRVEILKVITELKDAAQKKARTAPRPTHRKEPVKPIHSLTS